MLTRPHLLEPLRDRRYVRYWLASSLSFAGDGLYIVAVAWYATGLENPAVSLSLVGVAATAPNLVATLVGGALADRVDRRMLLMVCDLVRAVAIGAMGLLAWTDRLELPALVALVGVFGFASAVANPTITAYLPHLVSSEALPQANALLSMTRTLGSRVIGPTIGGALIAVGGVHICFLIDSASFLVSAAALLSLPSHRAEANGSHLLAQVVEGLRFTRSEPWLKVTLVTSALGLLFYTGPFYVLVPLLVREEFGSTARGYGAVLAAGGIAAFVGAAFAGHLRPRRPLVGVYAAWILSMVAYSAYGLAPSLPVLVLAAAVNLGAGVSGNIIWFSLLQARIPDEKLGRISSLDALASFSLVPLSMSMAGPAAALLGSRMVFIVGGLVATLIHVVGGLIVVRSRYGSGPSRAAPAALEH